MGRSSAVIYYLSRLRTFCWFWFAWASIAVDAWLRICALARVDDSAEKSASSIRERASDRFVTLAVSTLMAASRRFCVAPSVARAVLTWVSAVSAAVIASAAFAAERSRQCRP